MNNTQPAEGCLSPQICVVDAFTAEKFRGNPAAICFLSSSATEAWMQQIAAELNLSETAFLLKDGDQWNIRWFTPRTEVDLCGHATLASAHALWELGKVPQSSPISFKTMRSGELRCERVDTEIVMNFPICRAHQASAPEGLVEALGCDVRWIGKSDYDYLIEVANEAVVRSLAPDLRSLAEIPSRGFIVTANSSGPFDFVSRFFAPGAGIPEDPVTGSAHCTLAPYWAQKRGKQTLLGWQASARGGRVSATVLGERVLLGGNAVTIWLGSLV